jgi:serine/threonine protein kinase
MSQADSAEIDPLIDTRIDGRYTVRCVLGAGGMGVVYEGVHDDLGRSVAIKVLNAAWASDRTAVERFLREARTASSFSHGNIVDVTDLGRLPDGRPYLVMPRIVGVDLATLLAETGPQPAKRVASLLSGVAAALDLVHAKGFIHRDIKPENMMYVVREDGSETVMLLDFGIAAAVLSSGPRLTRQGAIFGTPHYLPPEVCAGERPDARGDVYALAAVAFELITGELPFPLDDIMQLMATKVTSDAPSLGTVTGRVFPPELEHVIGQGLARDPKQRFPTASGFVNALRRATDDAPVSWQSGVLRSTMRSDEHLLPRGLGSGSGFASTPSAAQSGPDRPWSAHSPTQQAEHTPSQPMTPRPPSVPPAARRGGYPGSGSGSGRISSPPGVASQSGSTRLPTGQDVSARLRLVDERMYRTAPVPVRSSWMRSLLLLAAGSVVVLALMQLKAVKRDDVPVTSTSREPSSAHTDVNAALHSAAAAKPVAAAPAPRLAAPQPLAATEAARPVLHPAPGAAAAPPLPNEPPASPTPEPAPPAQERENTAIATPQSTPSEPPARQPALQPSAAASRSPAARAPSPREGTATIPDFVPEPPAPEPHSAPVVVMRQEEDVEPDIPVRDFANDPESNAPPPRAPDSARAVQYTRDASSALLRGEVSRAVELSRAATGIDASYGPAWRTLGLSLERSGSIPEALEAYRRYLQLAPSGPQAELVRQRMQALGE